MMMAGVSRPRSYIFLYLADLHNVFLSTGDIAGYYDTKIPN